jgi:hypothetical protein
VFAQFLNNLYVENRIKRLSRDLDQSNKKPGRVPNTHRRKRTRLRRRDGENHGSGRRYGSRPDRHVSGNLLPDAPIEAEYRCAGPGLGAGDWPSFVEELIERRLPALFYVNLPEPRPRLLLRNQVAYPAGPQDEEMLPVIVSLVRARWPARPLGTQRA